MVMNAIINRKSVRKYSEKPISNEVLNKILEAGRLAPSWVNVQPWKFIVVKNQDTKDLLSLASGGQKQVKTANVLICCVADLDSWNRTNFGKVLEQKGLDEQTRESIVTSKLLNPSTLGEQVALLRSVEQVTYATAYMTLEAEEQGVGCCVVGATSNELTNLDESLAEQIKTKLNLNNRQVLVNILALGYEEPVIQAKKFRKTMEEVVFHECL